jgi:hypothetical protein
LSASASASPSAPPEPEAPDFSRVSRSYVFPAVAPDFDIELDEDEEEIVFLISKLL